ncbi:MAG TPA: hypothetical protein VJ461_04440 [Candidatus Nanoarchaeia archaeon]|nr:hypothetical protein [Candidatus Nanoarchaeia archaeon]
MNKALIAFAIISSLLLLIVGCKVTPPITTPTGEESSTGKAAETGITGDIKEVDNLNNELNDPELDNTDSYLDEVDW